MILFFLLITLLFQSSLEAQDKTYQLPEILITASRIPNEAMDTKRYTGNYSTITAEEIAWSGQTSITNILQEVAGMSIQDNSGFSLGNGLGPVVNFRGVGGFAKASTLILLNGVKQNQMSDNSVFWKAIPVNEIERIEILKGGSAGIIYGEGALSGVINIVTKKATQASQTTLSTRIGNYQQQEFSASYSYSNSKINVRSYRSRESLGGYRGHNDHHGQTGTLNIDYDINDTTSLTAYVLTYSSSTEFSDALTLEEVNQDRRQEKNPGKYHNRINQFNTTLTYHIDDDQRIDNTLFYRNRANDSEWFNSPREIDQNGFGWQGVYSRNHLGTYQGALTVGASLDLDHLNDQSPFASHTSDLTKLSGFTRYNFQPKDKWVVETGLRFDYAEYDSDLSGFTTFRGQLNYTGFTPSLGVKYHRNQHQTWFANLSQSFKIPPPFDIISTNLDQGKTNLDLQPEKATSFEVGVETKLWQKLQLKAALYAIYIKDEIFFDSITFKNTNLDTRRYGLELDASYPLSSSFKVGLSSGFSDSAFDGGAYSGNPLPLNPKQKYSAYASYDFGNYWNARLEWLWVRDQIRGNDFNGRLKATDYNLLNLKLGYHKDDFTFFVRLDNLLNEEYSTSQGSNGLTIVGENTENPMPLLSVTVGIDYVF